MLKFENSLDWTFSPNAEVTLLPRYDDNLWCFLLVNGAGVCNGTQEESMGKVYNPKA